MNLLHVIHTIDPSSGGTIEALIQTSLVLKELGVDIEIACLDAPESAAEHIQQLPWKVHTLGPGKFGNYSYSTEMKLWLEQNVNRYDAAIIHGCWQYHGLATSKACQSQGTPYYIYSHGMLDPWFNETYPLKKLKKMLYWRWGEHRVLKHANAVLFTCTEERLLARKSFAPYEVTEKVVGLGTKAPDESIESLSATRTHQAPYFLYLSRIQEKKGLDLLVEAYSKRRAADPTIPDLLIAGPEEQPEFAQALKTGYPQEGIHWIGSVKGREKWQLLANAEALTLPSHQENFGIVVAEALAVGTPTLISNKVNIYREIQDANAGLVENDDLLGTCKLIERWLTLSDNDKQTMSLAAIEVFQAHFEIRRASEKLLQFLQAQIR
jgi:glycosyltransferase involved in cell wall biosynthesis